MAEQTTVPVLRAMRDLLSNPDAWTQGVLARDFIGSEIEPLADEARCWCLIGAICKVGHVSIGYGHPAYDELLDTLRERDEAAQLVIAAEMDIEDLVPVYNDAQDTTHADVLALIDATIARLTR